MPRRSNRKRDAARPKSVRRPPARLERSIQNEIGRNLRAMYNDIVEEGVPDRFADLLAKLDLPGKSDKPTNKKPMTLDTGTRDGMLAAGPSLRAFAVSLCGNVDRADDLVQETLMRALANRNRSGQAPTSPRGCSRSCATISVPSSASGAARSKMPMAATPRTSRSRRRRWATSSSVSSPRARPPARRAARGPDPGRRVGLLLRGSGGDLRMRRWHDQEPRQSRPHRDSPN